MAFDDVARAVASADRLGADRRRDLARRPAEVLRFFDIKPGDSVAELMAGTGYNIGLLCALVGEQGRVVGHNTPGSFARRKGDPLRTRIAKCGLSNLSSVIARCDEIMLPTDLDAVLICQTYHDAVWTGIDRAAMNARIYAALKPGGVLGIIDHHAAAGMGFTQAKSHHRIEKSSVIADVAPSGLVFEAECDALENGLDRLDIDVHDDLVRRKTSRFILKFRKPLR